jgi:uncharacterized protein
LIARSKAKLQKIAAELHAQFGIAVKTMNLDLSGPAAPQQLFDTMKADGIAVDFLVNNAGTGKVGLFAEISLEDTLGQVDLNLRALTHLTRLFLGPMVERRSGKILNVASTAGFQPGPLMAVYFATKAYVISFSEAIANELKGSGVVVSCLCPGPTDTEFQKRAGAENSRLFKTLGPMTARVVAEAGYRALMKGKTLVIPGSRNRLLVESVRISPRKLATRITRWLVENAN